MGNFNFFELIIIGFMCYCAFLSLAVSIIEKIDEVKAKRKKKNEKKQGWI